MTLRIETKLIADGRRLASRSIVMQSLGSIPCYAFRKVILPVPDSQFGNRTDETWGGLGVASSADEHAFDYEPLGHAMMTMEAFIGGGVHDGNVFIQPDEVTMAGQVEPYDITLQGKDRLRYLPNWAPEVGDLFCMLLAEDNYIYVECVGRTGSSIMSDFGVKYVFNQKYDLGFLPTFDETQLADISPIL